MSRHTHKDADRAVERLAEALGVPCGHYEVIESTDRPDDLGGRRWIANQGRDGRWFVTKPGGIVSDYNPIYGGCVIEQISDDGGTWVSHPFSQSRMGPREFVDYVSGILQGIDAGRAS